MILGYGNKNMQYYSNYLKHHGINGQRWGVKNGPPYPLDYQSHSSKEKSSNAKSIIDGKSDSNSKEDEKEKKGLTDKQKNTLKAIGITAGVAVSAYAAYKLYKNPAVRKTFEDMVLKHGNKTLDELDDVAEDVVEKIDLDKEFSKLGIKKINNGAGEKVEDTIYWANKNSRGWVEGRDHNCISCAFATEMRRRGYDVCSKEQNGTYNVGDVMKVFGKPKKFKGETISDLADQLESQGVGTRGIFMATYRDKSEGSHFFNYEIGTDGKVRFFDGQQQFKDYSILDMWGENPDNAPTDFKKSMFFSVSDKEPNVDALMNYIEPNDDKRYDFADYMIEVWRKEGAPETARTESGLIKKGYNYYAKGSRY